MHYFSLIVFTAQHSESKPKRKRGICDKYYQAYRSSPLKHDIWWGEWKAKKPRPPIISGKPRDVFGEGVHIIHILTFARRKKRKKQNTSTLFPFPFLEICNTSLVFWQVSCTPTCILPHLQGCPEGLGMW